MNRKPEDWWKMIEVAMFVVGTVLALIFVSILIAGLFLR